MYKTIRIIIPVLLLIGNTQAKSSVSTSQGFRDYLSQYQQQLEQNQPLIEAASETAQLLSNSIQALVRLNLTCQSAADCTGVATGVKPCGGAVGYIVYSKRNKYVDTIEQLGKDAQSQSSLINQLSMLMSDCSMPSMPRFGCVDGICRDCDRIDQKCTEVNSLYPLSPLYSGNITQMLLDLINLNPLGIGKK